MSEQVSQDADSGPAAGPCSTQYLDQVNRSALDFDLERVCSETMATRGVYACCVCGKYYAGKAQGTPAWRHAAEAEHRVWISLDSATLWLLPDGVRIESGALADMVHALAPTFTPDQVAALPEQRRLVDAVDGSPYLPGYMGLANLGRSDYMAAVLHLVSHVAPLRDACLLGKLDGCTSDLVRAMAKFMRRVWSPHNYKSTCSPLEFAHAIAAASDGKFRVDVPADASVFVAWLLHTLHRDLQKCWPKVGGKRQRPRSVSHTIIADCFAGKVRITQPSLEQTGAGAAGQQVGRVVPAFMLTLDLPVTAVYKDEDGEPIIPTVPLAQLLREKFAGLSPDASEPSYELVQLPPYLLLALRRFKRNDFFLEKNNTVVSLPDKFLDLSPCTANDCPPGAGTAQHGAGDAAEQLSVSQLLAPGTSVATLKACARDAQRAGAPGAARANAAVERPDLVAAIAPHVLRTSTHLYDLTSAVVHASPPQTDGASQRACPLQSGQYITHALHDATGQWFQLEDVDVSESHTEAITLAPTQLLLYRHRGWCPHTLKALASGDMQPLAAVAQVQRGASAAE